LTFGVLFNFFEEWEWSICFSRSTSTWAAFNLRRAVWIFTNKFALGFWACWFMTFPVAFWFFADSFAFWFWCFTVSNTMGLFTNSYTFRTV
jgi:hypothetical protein